MNRLVITRGLPGCGKTTRARAWVAIDPRTRCRVNRDDLREMFHASRFTGISECEEAVTEAQYAAIRTLLQAGRDVVSDDTWLHQELFYRVRRVARSVGAEVEVWDLRGVPLSVCLERNASRVPKIEIVPEAAIVRMHERYILQLTI